MHTFMIKVGTVNVKKGVLWKVTSLGDLIINS